MLRFARNDKDIPYLDPAVPSLLAPVPVEKSQPISPYLAVLAVLTALLTWGLIMLGGVVHGTGSSLACPDWPTCHGTFFPEMVGGVAIEHTHRLVASAVGFMTILLVIFTWRTGNRNLRNLSLLALFLVIFQGVLGGITVLMKLPPFVSIGHLATSMAFLALMSWIAASCVQGIYPSRDLSKSPIKAETASWVLAAIAVTFIQIVLGGVVRHLGAGLACLDLPLCQGSLWPEGPPWLRLHMAHRIGGVITSALVIAAAIRVLQKGGQISLLRFLAGNLIFLVLIQVGLGLLSVATTLDLFPVTAHLGVGALLWVNLVLLYFFLSGGKGRIEEVDPS